MQIPFRLLLSLFVLGLIVAPGAGTAQADPATAGTHIAPGGTSNERGANAIPDGAGGVFVAFENMYLDIGPDFWSAIARLGPDGSPVPGWLPLPIVGYHRLAGDPWAVSIAYARPDRVWLFSDFVSAGQPLFRMLGPDPLVAQDTMGLAQRFEQATVATPVGFSGDTWLTTGMLGVNNNLVLRVGVLQATGAHDSSLPDIPVTGLGPGANAELHAFPDGTGGVWCTLNSSDVLGGTAEDLVAIRLLSNGHPAWPVPSHVVCAAGRAQTENSECSDGAGGAFVAWTDRRSVTSSDVYGLHMLADGSVAPGWPLNGKVIASGAGEQYQPHVASDGAGGCWVAWTDSRSGENDIYFTRLLASGAPAAGFPVGGSPLCAATGPQNEPRVLADGTGGFYAVWVDARDGEADLYGQHVHSTGVVTPGWIADGVALCTEPHPQQDPLLVLASPGHPIAIWSDTRAVKVQYQAMALPGDLPLADVPGAHSSSIALSTHGPARELEFLITTQSGRAASLELFDLHGGRVARMAWDRPLHNELVQVGSTRLDAGLYWARLTQGSDVVTAKAILLR